MPVPKWVVENYRSFSDNEALGVTWYKRHRLYKRRL